MPADTSLPLIGMLIGTVRTSNLSQRHRPRADHVDAAAGVVGDGVDDRRSASSRSGCRRPRSPAARRQPRARTSAKPCGALSRSCSSTSATSPSARGWIRRDAGISIPSPYSVSTNSVPKSGWSTPICCLHRLRGDADLAARDATPGGDLAVGVDLLDRVGGVDVGRRAEHVADRRDRHAVDVGVPQRVGDALDQGRVDAHRHCCCCCCACCWRGGPACRRGSRCRPGSRCSRPR